MTYVLLTVCFFFSYKSLPRWLRKFTPASLYIKIMDESVTELKKGKNMELCNIAVDVLNTLIGQDLFRNSKKSKWYAEKALILHKYLQKSDEVS